MSFTIKCDKCGKEKRLITEGNFNDLPICIYHEIPYYSGQIVSISIDCTCGNEIYETDY